MILVKAEIFRDCFFRIIKKEKILMSYLFTCCQIGAEKFLKDELKTLHPEAHFAFSRPGFVTFKFPDNSPAPEEGVPKSIFARASGVSLEKLTGEESARVESIVKELENGDYQALHVWSRDEHPSGKGGYEVGPTEEDARICQLVRAALSPSAGRRLLINEPVVKSDRVLDCVLVDSQTWMTGFHRATFTATCYPGGMINLVMPPEIVSRAWYKMEEALIWSGLPLEEGARVAELGSSPGGATQALLARGCLVLGVDPAEMDPVVLNHPHFRHLRGRTTELPKKEFRKIRWLASDMNVAPNYTLDAVEDIVTNKQVSIRGLILTLKLIEWDLAWNIPEYLDRIRSWGFNVIKARQLQHNRQEICVAALQTPFLRKS